MTKAFRAGELGKKVKRGKGKTEIILYPKIQRVAVRLDSKQVVFTVPTGMNPKEVFDHDWLFRQVFGEHIELVGDSKTFVLNVFKEGIQMFDYDAEEVEKAVEGLRLPIFIGRSRTGVVAYDMTEHPHLLIAGETGAGKSVQVRSILTSLVLDCRDRFELYCADLKLSEFHLFRGVADDVVYNAEGLHQILIRIKKELGNRGALLNKERVANVDELPPKKRPKYIIMAIDEVALLQKHPACMDIVEEISAIGRALGVFLILSMQRPDSDVLDGKLKNNLTVRCAFRHSDEINSRITIGTGDAAHIKQSEKGLMIHKLDGIRFVQAPYLKLDAARKLLEPYTLNEEEIEQQAEQRAQEIQQQIDDDFEMGGLPF
ncbi:FtsK/SpoIIIE domain-containing protein [Paenibacillus harenae]|uniref:FtsK/SpoIIIE domain-containing protein n=1 Tax=Paenibacillus harenae TaxID=306543 RepID=UPI000423D32D|nr:FtsK/SpoIIIE domain-containing protein [Paenibacillus harenae]